MSHEKVETEFVVKDGASAVLAKIHGAAERLNHSVGHIVGLLVGVSGLAGAFQLHETVTELNETFRAVNRIRTMTGVTANTAHGLQTAFKLSGIAAEEAERTIMMLTRKAQMMDDVGGAGMAKFNARMKKMGVNIKEDVVGQLEAMAIAAQKGKLDLGDLTKLFGVRGEAAVKFLGMLQKGPEYIKKIMEETEKSGINAVDVANFNRLQAAKRQLSHAFEEMVLQIYKHVLPGVTAVVNQVRKGVEAWGPAVEEWGEKIRENMHYAVSAAKVFAGYMAAARVAGYFGTTPIGAVKGAVRTAGSLAAGAGRMLIGGVGERARVMGMTGGLYAGMVTRGSGAAVGAGSMLGGGLGGLIQLLLNVGKLSVIGLVIVGAIAAIKALISNVHGVRDRLVASFGRLTEAASRLKDKLMPAITAVAGALGWAAEKIMTAVTWLLDKISWLIGKIPGGEQERPFAAAVTALTDTHKRVAHGGNRMSNWEARDILALRVADAATTALVARHQALAQQMEAVRGTQQLHKDLAADVRGFKPEFKQDFRGSKFDITQQFAEGFEPDRVATVFAAGVAAIGERALQSGLGPTFAVR